MTDALDIKTLSRETGVGVRTIRYYLAEKLLPPPHGRGPATSYGPGHRDRLLLIRRLQEAHQPLAVIRERLQTLNEAGIAAALAELGPERKAAGPTAADYVRQVLATSSTPSQSKSAQRAASSAPLDAASTTSPASAPTHPAEPERSTWERIRLHPSLEIHVRRPLTRADQRRLEALLEQAKRLFADET